MDGKIWDVVRADPRYAYEAYEFLCDAVAFTQEVLGRCPHEDADPDADFHVGGEDLARGAADLAVREFGMMAPVVFRHWGIRTTDDIGEIVFNLIKAERLSQSDRDDREDFCGPVRHGRRAHQRLRDRAGAAPEEPPMTLVRLRFAVALVVFLAWLGWLAVAVAKKGEPVLSRAQLLNATHLVVADVTLGDGGLPSTTATVVEVLRGDGVPAGPITVLNLDLALPAGAKAFPGPGVYLLPLTSDGRTFRVAGLPRSPGYEPAESARPVIYPATEATRAQARRLAGG